MNTTPKTPATPPSPSPQNSVTLPIKKPRKGGLPARITPQIIVEVTDLMKDGLPLKRALALHPLKIPFPHFQRALEKTARLSAFFAQREAAIVADLVKRVSVSTQGGGKLDVGAAWVLERTRREEFGQAKSQIGVQVNNVIGLSDAIPGRIRQLLREGVTPDTGRNTHKISQASQVPVVDAVSRNYFRDTKQISQASQVPVVDAGPRRYLEPDAKGSQEPGTV